MTDFYYLYDADIDNFFFYSATKNDLFRDEARDERPHAVVVRFRSRWEIALERHSPLSILSLSAPPPPPLLSRGHGTAGVREATVSERWETTAIHEATVGRLY